MKIWLLAFLAFLEFVLAQQIIVEYGLPETCEKYEDCQPYVCNPATLKCDNCTAAPDQCPSGYCDAATGQCSLCTAHAQCATNLCDLATGNCASCTSNESCVGSTGLCDAASGKCIHCTSDIDCPTRLCVGGACVVCTKDADCRTTPYLSCRAGPAPFTGICSSCGPPDGAGCLWGMRCNAATGACECLAAGESCTTSAACCSGACVGGKCVIPVTCAVGRYDPATQSCVCDPGDTACLAQLGEGATVERRTESRTVVVATAPPEVLPEQKVVAVPIVTEAIFRIFGFEARPAALTRCYRGAPCATEEDCCGVPCVNGRCAASMTLCTTSGDCYVGYCEGGTCRRAPTMGLLLAEMLRKPTEVGCAGIVECLPGQVGCINFCSAISAMFALIVAAAGGAVFKVTRSVPLAFAGAALSAAIGLVTYPFLGIVIGIIMIALVVVK